MQSAVKPIAIANWKSYGSFKENEIWAERFCASRLPENIHLAVCPPFPYISQLLELFEKTQVLVGAQNLSAYEPGAYTGEVSAEMLRDLGCEYVIIGHSERRTLYSEDDLQLVSKLQRAVDCGLTPIFCVGETLQQRERSQTETVLSQQLSAVASALKSMSFVLAYEPVWAIGTGKNATPEQAQQTHNFLRSQLTDCLGEAADGIRIIYGGSVNPDNAKALFVERDIDGGLIGGASLKAEDFLQICKVLEETKEQTD